MILRNLMFKQLQKAISFLLIVAFINLFLCVPETRAGEMIMPLMPAPGTMVKLSAAFIPSQLKGIIIHPDNALQFDFLIQKGNENLNEVQKKIEYNKLIKYFLASLTIPDEDQWVNLSPYEKDRIIKANFGKTQMGRDLLTQDYFLKQITSSLMYPESNLGKKFWERVYQRAHDEYGTSNVPVNTFNKVWIVPDQALVYESGNTAYIVKSHLKVMLEEDYLALQKNSLKHTEPKALMPGTHNCSQSVHLVANIVRDIILPELEKEVNQGKNFALLRQIYSGMVLATWYKKTLKESLLGKVYSDKSRVNGVDQNPKTNERIYQTYLIAFKKGVFNFIQEDIDVYSQQSIPRKYFAGGWHRRDDEVRTEVVPYNQLKNVIVSDVSNEDDAMVNFDPSKPDAAMNLQGFDDALQSRKLIQAVEIFTVAKADAYSSAQQGINDAEDQLYKAFLSMGPTITWEAYVIYFSREGKDKEAATVRDLIKRHNEFLSNWKRDFDKTSDVEEAIEIYTNVRRYYVSRLDKDLKIAGERLYAILSQKGDHNWDPFFEMFLNGNKFMEAATVLIIMEENAPEENKGLRGALKMAREHYDRVSETVEIASGRTEDRPHEAESFLVGVKERFEVDSKWMATWEEPVNRLLREEKFGEAEGFINDIERAGNLDQKQREALKFAVRIVYSEVMKSAKPWHFDDGDNRDLDDWYINFLSELEVNREKAEAIFERVARYREYLGPHDRMLFEAAQQELRKRSDRAMNSGKNLVVEQELQNKNPTVSTPFGGIDLNSANLNLKIKRDGRGVPLPVAQQDMAQLSQIQGFTPTIVEIWPARARAR